MIVRLEIFDKAERRRCCGNVAVPIALPFAGKSLYLHVLFDGAVEFFFKVNGGRDSTVCRDQRTDQDNHARQSLTNRGFLAQILVGQRRRLDNPFLHRNCDGSNFSQALLFFLYKTDPF